MGYLEKVNKILKFIDKCVTWVNDLNEKYITMINELRDQIEELKNSIGEKSAQYIMMKLSKINKKYEDLKKGFYQKIDDMNEDMADNVKTMFEGLKGTGPDP